MKAAFPPKRSRSCTVPHGAAVHPTRVRRNLGRGAGGSVIAGLAGMVLLASSWNGCAPSQPDTSGKERFPYIQDENFSIKQPSEDRASATGIGCGGTEKEATRNARQTAQYNLRGISGNGKYEIQVILLRKFPKQGLQCVEVEAGAVPSRQ
jgi:hypothetical protein